MWQCRLRGRSYRLCGHYKSQMVFDFHYKRNLHDCRDHRMNLFRCRCNRCRCDFGAGGSDLGRWRGCMSTFRADSRCQGNINGGSTQSSDDNVTTSCSDMLGDWARCDIRADNHGRYRSVLRLGRAVGCYNWRGMFLGKAGEVGNDI